METAQDRTDSVPVIIVIIVRLRDEGSVERQLTYKTSSIGGRPGPPITIRQACMIVHKGIASISRYQRSNIKPSSRSHLRSATQNASQTLH
jgi:hypothetical protein